MEVGFVSVRRLVQVAEVVNIFAEAENWAQWEALRWLAQQVKAGELNETLCIARRWAADELHEVYGDEAYSRWASMEKQAALRKTKADSMPAAASTWCIHVNNLLDFAKSPLVSCNFPHSDRPKPAN